MNHVTCNIDTKYNRLGIFRGKSCIGEASLNQDGLMEVRLFSKWVPLTEIDWNIIQDNWNQLQDMQRSCPVPPGWEAGEIITLTPSQRHCLQSIVKEITDDLEKNKQIL